jgi:hypothetical protein
MDRCCQALNDMVLVSLLPCCMLMKNQPLFLKKCSRLGIHNLV